MDTMAKRLAALEQAVAERDRRQQELEQAIQEKACRQQELERRLRGWRWGALALAAGLLLAPMPVSRAATNASTSTRLRALEAKLEKFSIQNIDGEYSVVLEGANLHIRNGLGATNGLPQDPSTAAGIVTNGLGNLIVGYNELRGSGNDSRGGSHNVIVGIRHNFASVGGIVVGFNNGISGAYSSVSGGANCAATGQSSSVSGGVTNLASGIGAAISGGSNHTASGFVSAVSGGAFNRATGAGSSVSGGQNNGAIGQFSSVAGGGGETVTTGNQALGLLASVSGGERIRQAEVFGWSAGSYGTALSPHRFRSP